MRCCRTSTWLRAVVLAVIAGLPTLDFASDAAWPQRPVTIVVPYPAGGGTDALARALGQALSARWKQPVLIENLPGGDGTLGTGRVVRSPPDGYKILMQVNQMLLDNVEPPKLTPLDDLKLVSMIQRSPLSFAVSSKFPGNTIQEFAAYCKTAKPSCSWGSATKYGQLIGQQLMDAAGIAGVVIHVPYKGTAPMVTDLLGGTITMALPAVSSGLSQYKGGNLKFLAVGSAERFKLLPQVPTLVESGLPVYGDSWYGLMVPKKVPAQVFAKIAESVAAVSTDPALLASIEFNAAVPVFSTPQGFADDVARESKYLQALRARFPIDDH